MRSIFAFILGIAVTVGGTYLRDAYFAGDSARPLVNWPEVADSSRATIDSGDMPWFWEKEMRSTLSTNNRPANFVTTSLIAPSKMATCS